MMSSTDLQQRKPVAAAFPAAQADRVYTVDRRQAKRVGANKLTAIHLSGGADAPVVAACITDFSATGLGMVVARPLTPGQRFQVDIREAGGMTALLYAVVRCDPWNGDTYRVGAVLLEVTAPQVKRPATTRVQRAVARLRQAVAS